jgi:hypothetical protein
MENEFEKWHKRFEAKDGCAYIHRMAGWKAALEWVLKDLRETYNNDFENSDIVRHIEQEMKNTNLH